MDYLKLLELAAKLNVPGLVGQGIGFVATIRANLDRARDVLAEGTREELDAIHNEAIAMADHLDALLADAERR